MRIAHLADLHLGFRMYDRMNPRGANQREADVAAALRWCVDDLLDRAPDAVVIAGDLFHSLRPTNAAIMFLFSQLQRIRADLPRAEILIVAGNHDSPRSAETSSILPLYQALGVTVALGPKIAQLELSGVPFILCPSGGAIDLTKVDVPDGAVLVCHGEAPGESGARSYWSLTPSRDAIPPGVLEGPWSYCALGHEHVFKRAGGRGWYAGSPEYTSTDPWGELKEQAKRGVPGKGYALVELGAEPEFRYYAGARRHLDLPPIEAAGMGAATLTEAIRTALDPALLEGAVARLVVKDVDRAVRRAIDYPMIREIKAAALHLSLELRGPKETGNLVQDFLAGAARAEEKRKGLVEMLDDFLAARQLPDDVDRGALRELGRRYISAARDGRRELGEGPVPGDEPEVTGGSVKGRGDETGEAAPAATSPALPTTIDPEA